MAIGHVDGWASDDGLAYIEPETELPSIIPICRVIAECDMSWTLPPTGGDLIGHHGERFAIVFRGSPSLPFLHKDDLDRLRVHRKHCLRTKEQSDESERFDRKGPSGHFVGGRQGCLCCASAGARFKRKN